MKKQANASVSRPDSFVIYWSKEDECWVAHSLNYDEFGTGGRIVEALADGLAAVDQVIRAAARDPEIDVFRLAPSSILNMSKKADRLPYEFYEIAHKMARGEWPKELTIDLASDKSDKDFHRKKFSVEPDARNPTRRLAGNRS